MSRLVLFALLTLPLFVPAAVAHDAARSWIVWSVTSYGVRAEGASPSREACLIDARRVAEARARDILYAADPPLKYGVTSPLKTPFGQLGTRVATEAWNWPDMISTAKSRTLAWAEFAVTGTYTNIIAIQPYQTSVPPGEVHCECWPADVDLARVRAGSVR